MNCECGIKKGSSQKKAMKYKVCSIDSKLYVYNIMLSWCNYFNIIIVHSLNWTMKTATKIVVTVVIILAMHFAAHVKFSILRRNIKIFIMKESRRKITGRVTIRCACVCLLEKKIHKRVLKLLCKSGCKTLRKQEPSDNYKINKKQ